MLLALLLAANPYPLALPRGCHNRSCVRSRVVAAPAAAAPTTPPNISNAITAGDKSGNWWVLQTDGTMLASSSLTLSAVGSPSVSPITLNGSSQYYAAGTAPTFPTGNFSVVCVVNLTTHPASKYVVAKWDGSSAAWVLLTGTTSPSMLVFTSTSALAEADSAGTWTTGTWVGIAGSYTSATSTAGIRYLSTTNTGAGSGGGITAANPFASVGGGDDGSALANMQTRGCFFTEKVLSDADIDRIIAGAM
jgi:hypothetical protein